MLAPTDLQKPPKNSSDLHDELQRMREERLGRKLGTQPKTNVADSPVLSSLPNNNQDPFAWAHGDKRLV